MCAFLAQQATEKALKAVIVHQTGEEPPRVHSIQRLADLAGMWQELPKQVVRLDDVYVASRYPDATGGLLPYEEFDETRADGALRLAHEVLSLSRERML